MQYEEVVNKISRCDRLARRICTGYSRLAGLERSFSRYGGATNATGETSFEAQAYVEIRSGVRRRRVDFFARRRRIRGRRADDRCGEVAYHWTGSRIHAWRGRNRRRQPGNLLCFRQGKRCGRQERRAGSTGLRRLPGLRRTGLRRTGLPGLQRLRLRRWLRRLRLRMSVLGSLPALLSQTAFRLRY
jgi:hypothetical protein